MAKLTPQEYAEKQASRLKSATTDIRRGVEKVTEAPTVKAALAKDKMRARLLARIDDGTWERRLRAVTLEEWKRKMLDVGVNRIAAGIDAANAKVVSFAEQLLPAVDAAKAKIAGMPSLTIEDSINRMTGYIREMSKFRKK